MSREVDAHRVAEGREEGLVAEAREEPEALQLVFDRILYLGETQLDAGGAQGVIELADGIGCGDVDARDRFCRDDEPTDVIGGQLTDSSDSEKQGISNSDTKLREPLNPATLLTSRLGG